jgi:VIT1/CCC1 family predicted Fe2+/Mn2+ transporter
MPGKTGDSLKILIIDKLSPDFGGMMGESPEISRKIMRTMLEAQRTELTEYHIYRAMAKIIPDEHNAEVLSCMADDELRHYRFWKERTGRDVSPNRIKIWAYYLVTRLLGLSFGTKLMEHGENMAGRAYKELSRYVPEVVKIAQEEEEHEMTCAGMLREERIKYASSIVLGLNDALVELTGAVAGFTFALRDAQLVALTALITGVAASLSMAASEYLSTRTGEASPDEKHPVKAALYTGGAYILAVIVLVMPYILLSNVYASLVWTLANAVVIILAFTFYISVAKGYRFGRRFGEMVAVSMGIAAVSFLVGLLLRSVMGVQV